MVSGADQIDVLLRENVKVVFPLRFRAIVQAVAFDAVASINKQDVYAVVVSLATEVLGEGDEIAPVG